MNRPKYIDWLVEETGITLEDGVPINCYRIDYQINNDILNEWALHLRKHYISDSELKDSTAGLEICVEEYLEKYVIPQKYDTGGPTARSNDITEILFSDLFEFILGYTVPRCKQENRSGKCLSEHGTDFLGYKFKVSADKPNKNDELVVAEVKAELTGEKCDSVINKAITDSKKDEHRCAHTLDFYRKRLKLLGNTKQASEIARFQMKSEDNYVITLIGASINSREKIENDIILGVKGSDLKILSNQKLFYIHGRKLMELAHNIYERCKIWE